MSILRRGLPLIKLSLLFTGFSLVILSLGVFLLKYQATATALQALLSRHKLQLTLIRYMVLAVIVVGWCKGIKVLGKYRQWDAVFTERLCQKSFWVFGFFILFELVVVDNVVGMLLARFL